MNAFPRSNRVWIAVAAMAVAVTACGDKGQPGGTGDLGQPVRLDDWCRRDGLDEALRQTAVVIDERAVRPGQGAELRTANPELFALVTGLADAGAGQVGALAPRERLSIYLAPTDGGAPRLILSGCLPAMSAQEIEVARAAGAAGTGGLSTYVTGGLGQELESARQAFQDAVLLALSKAARAPVPGSISAGGFTDGNLMSSLGSANLVIDGAGVPRFFLFTNLRTFPGGADRTAARQAGFAAAREAEVNLGGADVVLVGPGASSAGHGRDFAQAFFLGSQGRVLGWGGAAFNALPAAPVEVRTYTGEIVYPADRFPMRLVIGRDAQNRLVNSWLIVRSDTELATPIGGSLTCAEGVCRLVSDRGGLAQQWSPDPDPEPEFTPDLPLSGLRNIEAELTREYARGEISDPHVGSFEGAPGTRSLTFNLTPL
ncbi:hypothetical protein [Brevundimonas sp.]|uniref:hypothetical protein n=1 Tax=Brevundimonas sp. TaxID=1871086 RepID=UPI0027380174|nr:hypothetical protein [Brevundimonas sp.]MDP3800610.1 hypothetical protein [Brevundimonas sp.]